MSSLQLIDLTKIYQTRGRPPVEAVSGFELEVGSGELVALLGPSGCGKSTTLRMVAGLEHVTGGDIRIGGTSVAGLPPQRRNIGVAFENYALYPPLTVEENIAFGLRARRAAQREERVVDVASRIGLTDILHLRPAALSSGQKQRVALARAIARHPDVLLLDEPLSHLDAAQRDATRRELRHLQQELGYTTILVTHDQEEALSLADRVVVMNEGAAQQVGTPDEIYDDPHDLFVAGFVGEPPMNLLPGRATSDRRTIRLGDAVTIPVTCGDPIPERVVVGVRPEDVRVTDRATADLTGRVVVHEDLQEYGLVTVQLPGESGQLVAETDPGAPIPPNTEVPLSLHRDRTFVFATETGTRVR
ncbi:ABC transporter ATP-binding protein [Spiractinospora alimapuensis]|uniref:ABC transporter ATP-binding protein n=1 Tax=Spiractinospora alimapuensis TaxID=2820884 RepID=UPI001F1717F7|nr:ABC transporter ATP-binding protein [Spiractinospora alimapuensis]QVQ51758.1 ABC transporter ATP-binding protein [Spiractinospora alimapuensis]